MSLRRRSGILLKQEAQIRAVTSSLPLAAERSVDSVITQGDVRDQRPPVIPRSAPALSPRPVASANLLLQAQV